jgi:hypothetical protein
MINSTLLYGVRLLCRAFMKLLKSLLAKAKFERTIAEGDNITFVLDKAINTII